jgi:hypothetical protein
MEGTATKQDLRDIPAGESREWKLESAKKCVSVRSTASWLNTFEGMNLSTSINAKECTITVTNNKKV